MRIKKKNIGENLKNTENELNAIKGMVNQTSDELRNMGMDDKESKEIAVNVVTKSYVDSKNDEIVSEVVDGKHTVEYHSERTDETPFMINGIKWQYVNAIYPDGKRDIGVYRFDHDLTYDYNWFMNEVIPKPSINDVVSEVGPEKVHTAKFDRCVADVKEKGDVDNPYAICQASLGADAIKKSHQKKDKDEYVKTEDVGPGTGEDFEDIGPGGDIEAKADDYEKFQKLLKDLEGYSKEIGGMDDEEPMNDLPFESVRPKMTKDELIESVKRNTAKKRKVIKTISVKNLRNE